MGRRSRGPPGYRVAGQAAETAWVGELRGCGIRGWGMECWSQRAMWIDFGDWRVTGGICNPPSADSREGDLNEVAYGHGFRGRAILRCGVSPMHHGMRLAESHRPSCNSIIAKGFDSSSIANSVVGQFENKRA